ncbi:dihydroneopterin aldolase [Arthrobacter sp. H35-D1]|uniref:dihydroneopterin aldolase n=1 Tax=Arthrobacter sp. H35-D1 TaxID=3046202 RepID=UPI0024BB2B3D|nr:dihydroneopterin aldolase [Arthrobacter sp. H35-D1]MDJ0312201.1 dihydroneopterin aldolase [Arthrobacter sp. H35-D1]
MTHTDLITLKGVTAIGYHGVFAHEKRDGQPFITDVVLHLDVTGAAATDDLMLTANYGAVAETVVSMVTGEAYDLIETLSVRMAERILADFPVLNAVEVTVHKPKAPIQVPFGDVNVTVFRSREHVGTEQPGERLDAAHAGTA